MLLNISFLLNFGLITIMCSSNLCAQGFRLNSVDTIPPTITFTALTNANTSNRTINNFATITDNEVVSNSNLPRLYFKKSTDANTFGGNTSADNGWKYSIANNGTSPYSFTINNSILFGGSVSNGTIIEYFVVAQDDSNNMSSYPTGAGSSANPPLANVNSKPNQVFSYTIYTSTMGGNVYVGNGQSYTSLTKAGGVFEAINTSIINDDIDIIITSDLSEDGTHALNQLSGNTITAEYTLTIKSSNSTVKTISATNVADGAPMININGADNVTITGRAGLTMSRLTFRNTNVDSSKTGPVIQFNNGSMACTAHQINIESNAASTSTGSITIGTTGVNSATISFNNIRDANNGTIGQPSNAIYSNSTSNWVTINGNYIYNFKRNGVLLNKVSDSCLIESNSLYSTIIANTDQTGISVQYGNNHHIAGNYIGGNMADADGVWYNSGNINFKAISSAGSSSIANSIQNNTIRGIELTSTGKNSFIGIEVLSGKASIGELWTGNYIGNEILPIVVAGDSSTSGIFIASNDDVIINNNTITNLQSTGTGPKVSLKGIHYNGTMSPTISSNYIYNLTSHSSSTNEDSVASVCGISCNNSSLSTSIIANQINKLNAIHPTAKVYSIGIAYNTSNNYINFASNSIIAKNTIYGLTNLSSNTAAGIYGIHLYSSNSSILSKCTIHNNMMYLNNDTNSNAITIKGIIDNTSQYTSSNFYYNTIKIAGVSNTSLNSYCLERKVASEISFFNNIFINTRTGTGGSHYCFGNTSNNPSTNWNGALTNYNLLYSSNPSTIAKWNGDLDFVNFKTTSNSNANSKNANVFFFDESVADLHLDAASYNSLNLIGTPINTITDDYDGENRPALPLNPYIGADEVIGSPLPITLLTFNGESKNNMNLLKWLTVMEINSNYFEVQRLNDYKEFEEIGKITAATSSKEIIQYEFEDYNYNKKHTVDYYRLKMVDRDNTFIYSDVIAVKRNENRKSEISIYPNPASDYFNIWITNTEETKLRLMITDNLGKVVYENNSLSSHQINTIPIDKLPSGIYSLKLVGLKEIGSWRITKK